MPEPSLSLREQAPLLISAQYQHLPQQIGAAAAAADLQGERRLARLSELVDGNPHRARAASRASQRGQREAER